MLFVEGVVTVLRFNSSLLSHHNRAERKYSATIQPAVPQKCSGSTFMVMASGESTPAGRFAARQDPLPGG